MIRWKERFLALGLDGLDTNHPGQKAYKLTPALRAKILAATRKKPDDGSTHWSCRKLAAALSLSKDLVHRVWREAGIKPHRLERYRASNDPDLESKAADIIGLYLKSLRSTLPYFVWMRKRRFRRWTAWIPCYRSVLVEPSVTASNTIRHGTLSLYAALDTKTGKVHGKTAARHTSEEFVSFLEQVVTQCQAGRQIHIILDNLSAHKTKLVSSFLAAHPNVRLHFTLTYSSWLNQVEIWFARIEPDVIARGVFTSVSDLARKLRRYIQAYSTNAKPIQWKYSNPTRYIGKALFTTGH